MDRLLISPTAKQVLVVLINEPYRKFYVNELIRLTGRYPRSIQLTLKQLKKSNLVRISRQANRKYYQLDSENKFLPEIEGILRKRGEVKKEIERKVKGTEWLKIMNRKGSIPFVHSWLQGICLELPRVIPAQHAFGWHNSLTGGVYYNQAELRRTGEVIKDFYKKKEKFAIAMSEELKTRCRSLLKSGEVIRKSNLPSLTKKGLYSLLKDYQEKLLRLTAFLAVPLALETYLEEDIKTELWSILKRKGVLRSEKRFLDTLIAPATLDREQQDRALKLAAFVKRYGWSRKAKIMLETHAENYRWLPFEAEIGKVLSDGYFKSEINQLVQKFRDPLVEIKRNKKLEKERKANLERLLKEIGDYGKFIGEVKLLQDYIYLRTFRNRMQAKANYFHFPLLYEIAQRMELAEDEIKYLTYDEMLSWLKHGYGRKFSYSYESLRKEIARRMSGWAVLMWRGKVRIISGVKNIIEAMERYRIVAPGPQMVKVIKGKPACRGRATGRVKIVRKLSELNKVEKGDILVAKMTTPDYMIAIHKAAAIVTDEGGVTCHAAIVSREFNIPCIIGTKNATQILSDNDLIEVDANEGVVRVIESLELPEDVRVISGKTAYKGKVRGPARIVLDASDFEKVQEGDVLVAPQTTPEYLSSLYKVKGFIVDEDSITSHAMLYAKALRLPALIATNFARNVLRDGEMIELDATKGLVKRLGK